MQKYRILGWDISEIKKLLGAVSSRTSGSLVDVFENFAKETKRKTFSVRNFYYKLLELASLDKEVAEVLNKNGIVNTELRTNHFSSNETETLLRALLNNNRNISVRKACMELANGDDSLMMRYQNKYRNAIKNNPELVEKICHELEQQNVRVRKISSDNITVMPLQKNFITEKEIQSLFWGLVRLVKKSAEQDIENNLKQEAEFANTTLQNTLVDLRRKEMLIKELKEQNKNLKIKLQNMEENLQKSQAKMIGEITTISNLAHNSKMEELKNFINKLSINEKSQKE